MIRGTRRQTLCLPPKIIHPQGSAAVAHPADNSWFAWVDRKVQVLLMGPIPHQDQGRVGIVVEGADLKVVGFEVLCEVQVCSLGDFGGDGRRPGEAAPEPGEVRVVAGPG